MQLRWVFYSIPILTFLSSTTTQEFREGRQYYESSLFEIAQSKFANAVQIIASNDPFYTQENETFAPHTSAILAFLQEKCKESMEKKIFVAKKQQTGEFDLPIHSLVTALKDDTHPLPKYCVQKNEIPQETVEGVICVMLADIVMALALCHKMKGDHIDYKNLYQISHRLHTVRDSLLFFPFFTILFFPIPLSSLK